MEMEKEVERQLEAVDIDRVGAWEHPAPDPFIGVQTLPVAKSKHAKEPLRAGKEEAIEHIRPLFGEFMETSQLPHAHVDDSDPPPEGGEVELKHDDTYPQFFVKDRESGGEHRIEREEQGIPVPPPLAGMKKARKKGRLGHVAPYGPGTSSNAPPTHPSIGEMSNRSSKKGSVAPLSTSEPKSSTSFLRRHSHPLESPKQEFITRSSSNGDKTLRLPQESTEDKRLNLRFELDVLKMRYEAAIKSKDEVLMRWASHEALRDRNLSILGEIRHSIGAHLDEFKLRKAARDDALREHLEAKMKLDETQVQLMKAEQQLSECEAKQLGEKQMRSELERRVKNHTAGIMHAITLKQKRELEVKDLDIKVQLTEFELRRSEMEDQEAPLLYHPDYTTKVQVPIKLPVGSLTETPPRLPSVSTQSTVSMETPLSDDEIIKSAMKHNIPLPSTVHIPKLIAAPPIPFSGGTSNVASLSTHPQLKPTSESGTVPPKDVKVPTTPTMGFFPPVTTSTHQNEHNQMSYGNDSASGSGTIQRPSENSSVTYSSMSLDSESIGLHDNTTSLEAPFDPSCSAEFTSRAEQSTDDIPTHTFAPQSTCIPIQHK